MNPNSIQKLATPIMLTGATLLGATILAKSEFVPYFFGKFNKSMREKAASSSTESLETSSQWYLLL